TMLEVAASGASITKPVSNICQRCVAIKKAPLAFGDGLPLANAGRAIKERLDAPDATLLGSGVRGLPAYHGMSPIQARRFAGRATELWDPAHCESHQHHHGSIWPGGCSGAGSGRKREVAARARVHH